MSEIPWPKKAVPLNPSGFDKFYRAVIADREAARAIADELESNGKRVFHHVFRMTKLQKPSIDNIPDEEFLERVTILILELRSETPKPVRLVPTRRSDSEDDGTWDDQKTGLTCGSKLSSGNTGQSSPTSSPPPAQQ